MAKNKYEVLLDELIDSYLNAKGDEDAVRAMKQLNYIWDIYNANFDARYNEAVQYRHAVSRIHLLAEIGKDKGLNVEQRYRVCLHMHDERAHLNFEQKYGADLALAVDDREWLEDRLAPPPELS